MSTTYQHVLSERSDDHARVYVVSLADAMLALALGVIVGPVALNWVSPYHWVDQDDERLGYLT